ncbi:DJ-1/PfpI family protein [Maridesulfovibrio sp. FT414]|uniref:DJ-1/PfpI family protein n=1 Tax=Maridesulfovibrio sp. FT414 TaxID=2979469 RepID=UPI003D805D2C
MAKVAIILTQGFADWEYGLIAGTGRQYYGLDICFFAPETGPLKSLGGLDVVVSNKIDEVVGWGPEVVAVIGGTSWESEDSSAVPDLLADYYSRGGIVAGICGGVLALARSGLLNSNPHTTHALDYLSQNADGYSGDEHFCPGRPVVFENRVITAPGTAPVSFSAAVFEAAGVGAEIVQQFKSMMEAEHLS